MAGRRGWGEDSIYFDHSGECRDPEAHRHCAGRWRGVVSLKPGPDGRRRRKKVSGRKKTEVRAKLAELHDELHDGVMTRVCELALLAAAGRVTCPVGVLSGSRSRGPEGTGGARRMLGRAQRWCLPR